jgi:uncharacterized protein (TIGR03435 family)
MIMSRKYGGQLLVSLFAILVAQGAAQSPSNPSAVASPKKFDVASIRPSPPDQPGWMGIQTTGDRFEARSVSLSALVGYAYAFGGPRPQMVSESKGWIDSQRWDIVGKVDDPSFAGLSNAERRDRMRPIVQALLTERFHLKFHTELRPTSVYALVQAKGGAHVKEVPAPPEVKGDSMEAMKHYREENPGKGFPGSISCSDGGCTATAMTISAAAPTIGANSRLDRLIIDETGLKGHYDFSFRTPRNNDDDAMGDIEEDLGIKFEPRKVDLTTYVIDSAERPSAN